MAEYSPEKAGVGGSIPSLATMFSISYKPPKRRVGPDWSQNLNLTRLSHLNAVFTVGAGEFRLLSTTVLVKQAR